MADTVNIGTAPDNNTGDVLRTAFTKLNSRLDLDRSESLARDTLETSLRIARDLQIEGQVAAVAASFNPRTWATGQTYSPGTIGSLTDRRDVVLQGGVWYVAVVTHTAGATFAADLAAGKWLTTDPVQLRGDLATSGTGKGGDMVMTSTGKTVEKRLPGSANITAYYESGDGTDWAPAFGRALDAADHVVFAPRSGGYRFETAVVRVLTRDATIDFNGQLCIFDGGRIDLKGAMLFSGRTLSSDVARYATQIPLSSASLLQTGDILYINTSIQPAATWNDTKKDCVLVSSVSGSTAVLEEGVNFQYSTTDAGIEALAYRPVKVTLNSPNLLLIAADGDTTPRRMIYCEGLRDVTINAPKMAGQKPFTRESNIYRTGIYIYRCWGGSAIAPQYTALSYPIGIYGGSRNFTEIAAKSSWCHHGHADSGDWSSGYQLIGLQASDNWSTINTHPSFRTHASGFRVRNDVWLPTWRTFGGSWRDGVIHSLVPDGGAGGPTTPETMNLTPIAGYEYLNGDADFQITDVRLDMPNRTVNAAIQVGWARRFYMANLDISPSAMVVGVTGLVGEYICGPGNRIGPNARTAPNRNQINATSIRMDVVPADVPLVASAATVYLPVGYPFVFITGTTTITSISADGHVGRQVTLLFVSDCQITDGGNLALSSSFSAKNGSMMSLVSDGAAWYEITRSINGNTTQVVASAASMDIPFGHEVVFVTGTATISSIPAAGHRNRRVTLVFTDAATVIDGGNLALSGNFSATNGDALTLACNDAIWYEVARSPN